MQVRAEGTRTILLEAAAGLFDERGFVGTSISDIAKRSGRTSGAIYFHYASKEKLARAVIDAQFNTWPQLVARRRASARPALERMVALSYDVARAFRDDVVVRAAARLWTERKCIALSLPVPFVGWIEEVSALLSQAREEGDLGPGVVPDTAAAGLVGAFYGLHTISEALDGRRRIEERLDELWLLLLAGLQSVPDPAALLGRVYGHMGSDGSAASEHAGPGRAAGTAR